MKKFNASLKKVIARKQTRIVVFMITWIMLTAANLSAQDNEIFAVTPAKKASKKLYIQISGQLALPQNEFKQYSKPWGGFRIDAGTPIKDNPLSFGGEISFFPSGSKKDVFKGIEVETSSLLFNLHPFLRWVPNGSAKVKPFIDVSTGLTVTSTSTTSKIIDEPTFLEQVLFGEETEVQTTTHMDSGGANISYSVGAGLRIGNFFILGIRYQQVNQIKYANHNQVFVSNDKIVYEVHKIPLDMLTISLGISNWGN